MSALWKSGVKCYDLAAIRLPLALQTVMIYFARDCLFCQVTSDVMGAQPCPELAEPRWHRAGRWMICAGGNRVTDWEQTTGSLTGIFTVRFLYVGLSNVMDLMYLTILDGWRKACRVQRN